MIYLDNAATTRLSDTAAREMRRMEQTIYGNPASLHALGVAAERDVENARAVVARCLSAKSEEIVFTPGGTFADNAAVIGGARARRRRGDRVVISAIEHAGVRESAKRLSEEGFEVVACPPTEEGFRAAINGRTVLVSAMLVNNETGLILPVEKIPEMIRTAGAPALFHIDAVQAFGKMPVNVRTLGCDLMSVSSHKIAGPKGCGALFVKSGVRILPVVYGGGQEKGLVSGTLNTPAICGFAAAAKEAAEKLPEHTARFEKLARRFLSLAGERPYLQVNREDGGRYAPHIFNISFMGFIGENVLHFLEKKEIYVSVGSACSDAGGHGSILARLGKDKKTVDGAVRVSFGYDTKEEETDAFFAAADEAAKTLIRKYR